MKKDKIPHIAEQKIENYLNSNGYCDKETLIELVKGDVEVPQYVELKTRYIAKHINSIISRKRDEKGVREILGVSINGKTEYVKVASCQDKDRLRAIDKRLLKNMEGLQKTQNKVSNRILVLEGQIAMSFMENQKEVI